MSRQDAEREQALLERAERLWLDPDWDCVYGYNPRRGAAAHLADDCDEKQGPTAR